MRIVLVGALNGAMAVGLGAFAAHGLEGQFAMANAELFNVAVFYQALHAVTLVALGALRSELYRPVVDTAAWAFLAGLVLFCGSLYAKGLNPDWVLPYVTPLGGGAFIAGWLLLAVAAARRI